MTHHEIAGDRRLRCLDLFCGAGGASAGLSRAGFDVVGIDIAPQPRYPFEFIQADATCPPVDLGDFDFVWASPPCQRWTPHAQQRGTSEDHPNHIDTTRALLIAWGGLWCMENVPRAPLRHPVALTGCMFGLNTYRRRHFECSFAVLAPEPGRPFGPKTRPGSVTISGHSGGGSTRDGWRNGNGAAWKEALGIDWMLNREMAEAIPPAYSEFIGRQALRALQLTEARHAA
jgi:DNA (cytosine-5)-methyltransferase 1